MDDGRRRYTDLPRSDARIHADVDDEIRFDLDMRVRELMQQHGLTEEDARRRALHEFGDVEATRRYCATLDERVERRNRWSQWFDDLRQDIAFAWRSMRTNRGFSAVVLAALAVGLGANVAIYSVVRRVLIDRLPYRAPEELVRVYGGVSPTGGSDLLTPKELHDLAESPSMAGVTAFGNRGSVIYYGDQFVESVPMASVSPNFFTLLGSSPLLGRVFDARDVAADAPPTVMLTYDLWRRLFNSDPNVIGRQLRLGGKSCMVIGVMPREFVTPTFSTDLWLPFDPIRFAANPRVMNQRLYRGVARLRPAGTLARANADAATIAARWRADGSISPTTPAPRIVGIRDSMVGDVRPALLAVMAAAVLVLIITCTNVAGLFLARATSRRRELAVRVALGAGRGRLIRQQLAETTLYGAIGGALAVLLGMAVNPPLGAAASMALPNMGEIKIDFALTAMAIVVALACGTLVGIMPAIAATRVDLKESMSDAGRNASAGRERVGVRQSLVSLQIALAILLMVAAGLLLRSFAGLMNTKIGYSTDDHVLIFSMNGPTDLPSDQAARNAFYSGVSDRIRALPGVTNVGLTAVGPWNGPSSAFVKSVQSANTNATEVRADYIAASDEYFVALGTRIVRGRAIERTDRLGAPLVTVLSESVARSLFGEANPIGQRVLINDRDRNGSQPHEVVGVAEDYRPHVVDDVQPAVYISDAQENRLGWAQIVVRSSGDAHHLLPAIRQLVHEINPMTPLMFPTTMRDRLRSYLAPQQLALMLFGLFAALALTLAALGVYGVMSYVVATRTREFGIRTALGARPLALVGVVVRQGMKSAAAGAAIGLVLAFGASRLIAKLVFGVSVRDPLTFGVVPVLLIVVTLMACTVPAWRATRVDPVDALRAD